MRGASGAAAVTASLRAPSGVVSLASISGSAASSFGAIVSMVVPPIGCGRITVGSVGKPSVRDWLRASATNGVLMSNTVGSPSFSTSMLSWTLHDVQAPQSPKALITTSALAASAANTSGSAGSDGCCLATWNTVAPGTCSAMRAARCFMMRSTGALVLSKRPMRKSSEAGRTIGVGDAERQGLCGG